MTQENTAQQDLIRFIQILLRKKWFILISIIFATAPFIYLNQTTKPVYKATAELVFEVKQTGITDFNLSSLHRNENSIKNLIQEIKSWSLAHEVVHALPLEVLVSYLDDETEQKEVTDEKFTDIIIKQLSASPVPKSDIILVNAEASHPDYAAQVANITAEILIKRNLTAKLGEVHNTKETIQEQVSVYKAKVSDAERKLRDYKEAHQITNLEQEALEIFKRVTEAEVEYNQIVTSLNSSQERLIFVKNKLNKTRQGLVPAITTITSPWIQQLKEQLIQLEVQHTTLKVQNYDESHPKLRALSQQIEETKKSLREETLKIAKGENTIDPLSEIQKDFEEISFLEVEIHTYNAKERALREVLASYNSTLTTLPSKELTLGQLIRDKAVADKIYTMLLEKFEEAKIQEAERIANIRLIDEARPPKYPVRPNKKLNLILGVFLGTMLGVGLSLIIEAFNIKVRTEEEIERHMGLQVLGQIPKIRNSMAFISKKGRQDNNYENIDSKLITALRPNAPVSEAFRTLRTNIQLSQTSSHPKSIIVTSTIPQEGKSLIASNLAITTAQLGFRTLLVDADLRKPTIHTLFQLPMQPGLTNLFMSHTNKRKSHKNKSQISIATRRNPLDNYMPFIHATSLKNLYITTSGKLPINPSELLASTKMNKCIDVLNDSFDLIIFDMPPINIVTDAAVMAKLVDGILFVVRAGKTKLDQLVKAKKILNRVAKKNTMGVVLNNVDVKDTYSNLYGQYSNSRPYMRSQNKSKQPTIKSS